MSTQIIRAQENIGNTGSATSRTSSTHWESREHIPVDKMDLLINHVAPSVYKYEDKTTENNRSAIPILETTFMKWKN